MPKLPPTPISSNATPYALPASSMPGEFPQASAGPAPSEGELSAGHQRHGLSPENAKAIATKQAARHGKHRKR